MVFDFLKKLVKSNYLESFDVNQNPKNIDFQLAFKEMTNEGPETLRRIFYRTLSGEGDSDYRGFREQVAQIYSKQSPQEKLELCLRAFEVLPFLYATAASQYSIIGQSFEIACSVLKNCADDVAGQEIDQKKLEIICNNYARLLSFMGPNGFHLQFGENYWAIGHFFEKIIFGNQKLRYTLYQPIFRNMVKNIKSPIANNEMLDFAARFELVTKICYFQSINIEESYLHKASYGSAGRKDQIRAQVFEAANPTFAEFLKWLFDDAYDELKSAPYGFEKLARTQEFINSDPEVLAQTMVDLMNIDKILIANQIQGGKLFKFNGQYGVDGYIHSNNYLRELQNIILKNKPKYSDAQMAQLVKNVVNDHYLQNHAFFKSAIKIAKENIGGLTHVALKEFSTSDIRNIFYKNMPKLIAEIDAIGGGETKRIPLREVDFNQYDLKEIYNFHLIYALYGYYNNLLDSRIANAQNIAELQSIQSNSTQLQNLVPILVKLCEATKDFNIKYEDKAYFLGVHFYEIDNKAAPSPKWFDKAKTLCQGIAQGDLEQLLKSLLIASNPDRNHALECDYIIRGLIYLSYEWESKVFASLITDYALKKCFVTQASHGIANEKVGNSCIWALVNMANGAGVPYLARLLARIKYPKTKARINEALNEAAKKANISRGQLDEITIADYGLDKNGEIAFEIGGGKAIVKVHNAKSAKVEFFAENGNPLKSANLAMKADSEKVQEIKSLIKELEADLSAQIYRLQGIYLENRIWRFEDWSNNYLNHGLMRQFTQKLIWFFDDVAALPTQNGFVDLNGNAIAINCQAVRLWHPILDSIEYVIEWRDYLYKNQIIQPFAQAWREIYKLTDAELKTETYSNRWAGHILKQHQFLTLARINGWNVTHRMAVDAPNDAPWHIKLPQYNLLAEYWVEGAGGDAPEIIESGAYSFVSTDRLLFKQYDGSAKFDIKNAKKVALKNIPPIIFSEIMRNCDLFTAVSSIASDPNWLDRGKNAAHPNQWDRYAENYWYQNSFADLAESAKMRKQILERIIGRLKIANQCAFEDSALLVKGKKHEYLIHLGSAAVQIKARKQHICIVPDRSDKINDFGFIPFEGDRILSLIISKAILLANDDLIKDEVILRQL